MLVSAAGRPEGAKPTAAAALDAAQRLRPRGRVWDLLDRRYLDPAQPPGRNPASRECAL